jgi:tetraacyldisaccharide 4'-kinase
VIHSDEAREYAITAPDALVVVHRRRYEALVAQLSKPECREWIDRAVVVLDDGFQHRQLARDLDIVLVDGSPMQELLPHGWLREPASNIARADLVVRTKASVNALAGSGVPKHFDAQCDHTWTQFEVHDANGTRVEQLEWLRSRSVMTACGLGNPAHFEQMARVHAGEVVHAIRVADHRALTHATLAAGITRARANAGASQIVVLMTRKDFVKLEARLTLAVAVPTLALAWSSGVERMREAIRRVSSRPDARP